MSTATLPAHVEAKIRREAGGCWTWLNRPTANGYGRVNVDRSSWSAHRFVYVTLVGPIPKGLELDHLCRNRICVNPKHLEPVTHRENVRRGVMAMMPTCKNGHPWTPDNIGPRTDSWRRCKTCNREAARRFVQRHGSRRRAA